MISFPKDSKTLINSKYYLKEVDRQALSFKKTIVSSSYLDSNKSFFQIGNGKAEDVAKSRIRRN